MHRQFRSLDLRRGDPQSRGCRAVQSVQRRKPPRLEVHPYALDLLRQLDYDTGHLRSKSWDEFATDGAPALDFVFTVCDDAAKEVCPVWPGQPMSAHWGIPDPVGVEGTEAEKRLAFAEAYRMLKNRIEAFISLPIASLDRLSLKRKIDAIGQFNRIRRMSLFERYLTVWVFLCIIAGIVLGQMMPGVFGAIAALEAASVNLPVAVLIWLMIIPMLVKIDFGALGQVAKHWRGIGITLAVNWAIKPFTMAVLGWVFIGWLFRPLLPETQIDSYIAGLILLGAAPCTAMVFVWSNLTKGEPHFTLSQVALNDAVMVIAFAPIVALLLGLSAIVIPWQTLLLSVILYIVVPVIISQAIRRSLMASGGLDRFLKAIRAGVARGAAGDSHPALRLPGRADHRATPCDRAPRRAHRHPDLCDLRHWVCVESLRGRSALHRRAVSAHRGVQLL